MSLPRDDADRDDDAVGATAREGVPRGGDGGGHAVGATQALDGDVHGGCVLRAEWAAPLPPPPPICAGCLRESETWIRVTNLSLRTSEEDLYNLACPFGIINSTSLAVDVGGSRRQVGIVEFDQREAAEDAVRWHHGHVYDDLVLRVEGPLKL